MPATAKKVTRRTETPPARPLRPVSPPRAAQPAQPAQPAPPAKGKFDELDWELRLGFLIHDVSRLRRSAFDRCLKPLNVTRSQWWVLAYLSREDGMTQSQLAEELDLGKVAIGGLIDRLEKSGLVRRDADATDRRVNRVFLQPKSQQLIARMRKTSHKMNLQIQTGLLDGNLETTARTLSAMKHNLLRYLAPART